jgi:hypothetical protein
MVPPDTPGITSAVPIQIPFNHNPTAERKVTGPGPVKNASLHVPVNFSIKYPLIHDPGKPDKKYHESTKTRRKKI